MKQPDLYYPGSEVPERRKSEQGRENEGPLTERDKPLADRTNQVRIWTFL